MSGSGRRTKRKQLTWKTKGELVISGAAHNTTHRHTRADAFSFFSLSPPTLLFHFGPPSPPPPLALMRTRRMGKHSGKKERVRGESILSEFLPPFAQFRTMEAEAPLINLGTSQQHTHLLFPPPLIRSWGWEEVDSRVSADANTKSTIYKRRREQRGEGAFVLWKQWRPLFSSSS